MELLSLVFFLLFLWLEARGSWMVAREWWRLVSISKSSLLDFYHTTYWAEEDSA